MTITVKLIYALNKNTKFFLLQVIKISNQVRYHSEGKNLEFDKRLGLAVRVFANGSGDLGSIPDRVIPKTLKMELDTTLLNTQHYKVRFKGKVEQSRERSSALPYTLV